MKPTTPFSVCKEFCAGSGGASGTTFIPNVSPEGVISWTNDGGLENPDPVTIKGEDGYTPQKGKDYFTDAEIEKIKIDVKGDLPKVATSGDYNDLSDVPVHIINLGYSGENLFYNLDDLTAGGLYYDVQNASWGAMGRFIVVTYEKHYVIINGNAWEEKVWSQIVYGEGRIVHRRKITQTPIETSDNPIIKEWEEVPLDDNAVTKEYVDEKIKNISPGGGSTTNSINFDAIDDTFDSGVYLVDGREGSVGDGKCEVMVVSSSERGEGQFYFYDDGRLGYRQGSNGEWNSYFVEIVNVSEPIATQAYVDREIGDIETSLENIIAKYGLGGDSL